jgi:hypothetical protein
VVVSQACLTDAKRAYPVVVDPDLLISGYSSTFDSFVSSSNPSSNYYDSTYVRTGYYTDYGVRRTYLKFDLSSASGIDPNQVTSGYVRIEKYGATDPQVAGYRVTGSWSSATITWNNKPGYSTSAADHSDYAYNDTGAWWRMSNCTAMVKNWLDGTYSNYGLCVKDHDEDGGVWTNFYSSDAPSPDKPELHILYNYGCRSYEYEPSANINCMGYAVSYDAYITGDMLGMTPSGIDACNTLSDWLNYTQSKSETWMTSHVDYGSLAAYNSSINTSVEYRVALRVGWVDTNGDGELDANQYWQDDWDYHWWYETSTGQWAEKHGTQPSGLISGTSSSTNPYNVVWPLPGEYANFYTSSCRYYAVNP